ncbi:MAG: hypothetical protein K0Q96_1840 [Rubrobacteraceae bacterium]|nr:hypothetical protein [Rubrobacteraceae bacterium]
MNYGDLIRDAYRITLHNRFLWFFGFFAGGTGTNFVGNVPSGGGNFNFDDFQRSDAGLTAQVGQGLSETVLILGIVVVVLLIALFFIILAIISQGALADSVAAMDRGEGRRFGSAFSSGTGNFWRVLGYYVVFFLIALGLLMVIAIPVALLIGGTFAATQSTGARISVAVVVGILAVLLLIVIFIPLSIIGQYALRDIVVRRERVLGSVGSGYGLSAVTDRRPHPGATGDRAGRRRLHHGRHHRRRDSGPDTPPHPARGHGRHWHLLPRLLDARLPATDDRGNPARRVSVES